MMIQHQEEPQWFVARTKKPRGVIVVIHGLNQRPSSMNPLSDYLAGQGYHVRRITLPGHNEPTTDTFDSSVWPTHVEHAYLDARKSLEHLPTYVVGYSLGGLLATHLADSLPSTTKPAALILFAPAIALRTLPSLAATIHFPPALSWRTPNVAPHAYRRYPTTPAFWYTNTLKLNRQIQTLRDAEHVQSVPALVFLNPRDELVSLSGTESWIEKNGLKTTWKIVEVHPHSTSSEMAEHLIIDEPSLGASEWRRVTGEIASFLTSARTKERHPPAHHHARRRSRTRTVHTL